MGTKHIHCIEHRHGGYVFIDRVEFNDGVPGEVVDGVCLGHETEAGVEAGASKLAGWFRELEGRND